MDQVLRHRSWLDPIYSEVRNSDNISMCMNECKFYVQSHSLVVNSVYAVHIHFSFQIKMYQPLHKLKYPITITNKLQNNIWYSFCV